MLITYCGWEGGLFECYINVIITISHNRRGTPKKDCIIHGPYLRLLILVKGGERESEKAQITRDDGFCPEGGAYNHQEHHQGAKLHLHAPAYNRQSICVHF